ncbi:MAG: RNA polymerase factor sigma-32 [Acidobacteriota bacterium]|nr:MAG: RNA polymerase factor sigma-32 [Acidobacteriota bacterium]
MSPDIDPEVIEPEEIPAEVQEEEHEEIILRPETSLSKLSPLQRYLLEIQHFEPLSAEEEHRLAVRYQDEGDQEAAYRLVTANLSLVVKISRLYNRVYHNVIDLIQEGNIGLIEAVKRFDPHKGNRLPTYASWWIKAYIIKFIIDNFRIVRVGTTNERRRLLFNLRKEKEALRQQGIEPTPALIASRLQVTEEDVRAVESNIESGDLSLDSYVSEDSGIQFVDTLRNSDVQVDDQLARGELAELFNRKLKEFSKKLSPRELSILHERLLTDEPKTLQEIADEYGVTREAIRLSEKSLINKIKSYMEEALKGVKDVEFAMLG